MVSKCCCTSKDIVSVEHFITNTMCSLQCMLEFMNVGFIIEAVCFQLESIANNDSSV